MKVENQIEKIEDLSVTENATNFSIKKGELSESER